ncbi:MAG: hypothetical protein AAF702_18005 [Chloroflexota bacterium]
MNSIQTEQTGSRAIIIGGSVSGLLNARVLSEHLDEVIILEKDTLPEKPAPRQGVPQSGQTHSIHQKGAEIIQELFPDLTWDFDTCGVIPCDLGSEMRWFFFGEWMPRIHANVSVHWCDRPLLEWAIRQRVAALPNVKVISECKVKALIPDKSKGRIVGVTVRTANQPKTDQTLTADLIVDACGRGSRVDQWLTDLGYPQVPESNVTINLGYASGIYQLPEGYEPPWKALLISAKPGLSQKLGLIYRMPNNQIKVLLAGWFGDHPPTDDGAFLDFARSLPQPDVYEQLRHATPVIPVRAYKLPSNQWRRYEQVARWPDGLVVTGDAVCSFNPSFGQGMTVAALHAVALGEELHNLKIRNKELNQPGIAKRFQKEAARIVNNPWMITTGEDLRFPQAEGPRPLPLHIMHRYLAKIFDVAHRDPQVAKRFMEVMTFMEEPTALFRSDILLALARQTISKLREKLSIQSERKYPAAQADAW